MITCQQLWFSNLKIVRASNSLTISGTVVKSGPVANINLRIFNTSAIIEPNRVFTLVSSIKDAVRCISDTRVNRTGGNIWYYKKGEHGKDIRIADVVANSNTQVDMNRAAVWVYPDVATYGENFTFSITIYDVACYYGAFTNPPALKSPDVLPSNVFEVGGTAMKNINTVTTNKIGWYRLLRWYGGVHYDRVNSFWLPSNIYLHKFYFEPGYHAATASYDAYNSYEIECGLMAVYAAVASANRYYAWYLSVRNLGKSNNNYPKFRFARGTELLYRGNAAGQTDLRYLYYDLFLEVYYGRNQNSSGSAIYADNLLNALVRINNISGNPDGDNDVLVGSEVTPTIIGTNITIS